MKEMLFIIYFIIIAYFALGAVGFYIINRKKPKESAAKSWTKYLSYFFIINILFFAITLNSMAFRLLSILITAISLFEISRLYVKSGFKNRKVFLSAAAILVICSFCFYGFSTMQKETILFTFLIISIFDSFSQISGQLFGHKKIFPSISPNKTLEGLIGGVVIALFSAVILRDLYPGNIPAVFLTATGIIIFAFAGDISASYYKRIFQVKDFSNLIPGHGGFLDRFDSLIAAGAFQGLIQMVIQ